MTLEIKCRWSLWQRSRRPTLGFKGPQGSLGHVLCSGATTATAEPETTASRCRAPILTLTFCLEKSSNAGDKLRFPGDNNYRMTWTRKLHPSKQNDPTWSCPHHLSSNLYHNPKHLWVIVQLSSRFQAPTRLFVVISYRAVEPHATLRSFLPRDCLV